MSDTDVADWSMAACRSWVIGLDVAFATTGDHSAMCVGGLWVENGRSILGVREIRQFPKGTTAEDLADEVAATANKYGNARVCFDMSNNSAFASILAARFQNPANYLIGCVITNAMEHATMPTPFPVNVLGGKSAISRISLSKRQLIEATSAAIDGGVLKMTRTGDWLVLKDEFGAMVREVTAGGVVRYSAPAGKHDDLILALSLLNYGIRAFPAPRQKVARPRRSAPSALGWT